MPLSAKLKQAEIFAKAKGEAALEQHIGWFHHVHFTDTLRARNSLAHGFFMGINDEGMLSFETSDVFGVEGGTVRLQVDSLSMEEMAKAVTACEETIPRIEADLKLQTLRRSRREQPLIPHLKSQSRGKQKAKPRNPPEA
jgi:hypothetical protein